MGRLICPFNAKIGWMITFLCHVELIQKWQINQLIVDRSWTYISSPSLVCCTIGLNADLVQVLLKNQTNCMLFMHLWKSIDTYIFDAMKFRTIAPTTAFNVSMSTSSFPLEEGDEEVCSVMFDSISLLVFQDSGPHMSTGPLRDEITSGVPTCLESS